MAGELIGRWLGQGAPAARANPFEAHLEAHLTVGEAQALQADLDLLTPEADALIGPVAARLTAEPPSYDRLRLPPRAPHDVRQLEGARDRLLSADTSVPSSSRDAVLKEAKLHRLLQALRGMDDHIRTHREGEG